MPPEGLEPTPVLGIGAFVCPVCDSAPAGIVVLASRSRRLVYANPAAAQLFGYPPEAMSALSVDDLHPSESLSQVRAEFAGMAEGTQRRAVGVPCQRQDGSRFYADVTACPMVFEGEPSVAAYFSDPMASSSTQVDSSAARRARESEELFRKLVEGAPEAIFVQTRGKISYVNSAACAHFGAASEAELLGTDLMERIHPDFRDVVGKRVARINAERVVNPLLEMLHLRLDGTAVPVEVSAVPVELNGDRGALVFVRNITERKRAEEALRTAQRLESIGLLAGGIAHDFNNLLTGMFGNIDVARSHLGDGDHEQALASLTTVMGVLDRARSLTRQLLTFSRGGSPLRKPVDLGQLIQDATEFSLSGTSIERRLDLGPNLWWCNADEHQLAQVLDNLLINATQAMPNGGTLHVRARNKRLGAGDHTTLDAGPYVLVDVTDTGVGIPGEIIDHVFDPFFSTKEQGSGLGLATAYSIIKRHGGAIEAESVVGRGATFHLLVPALPNHSAPVAVQPSREFRGEGEILVLDEERFIIELVARMTKAWGFSVRPASNASEAVRVMTEAQAAGAPIPIAILDLTVPGGPGGKDIAGALRAINPNVKLIVSSGYSEDPVMAEPEKYGFDARLAKPYAARELRAVLQHIMTPR